MTVTINNFGTTSFNTTDFVRRNLILNLDAGNSLSYNGSGVRWVDLSGNNYNFNLVNSPIFEIHKGHGCFKFSGSTDYAVRDDDISHNIAAQCTITIVLASIDNTIFDNGLPGIECSRLFSVSDGSASNNDYNTFFTIASCVENNYGLWYKNSPAGIYPLTSLTSATDDYKILTFKWTASNTAYVFLGGTQQTSSAITSAFAYTSVNRMAVAMNANLTMENAYVRVAQILMYDRELSTGEVQQNYAFLQKKFNL